MNAPVRQRSPPGRYPGRALVDAVRSGGGVMGGYQAIMINPETGMLHGGSDPRKDGQAVGY